MGNRLPGFVCTCQSPLEGHVQYLRLAYDSLPFSFDTYVHTHINTLRHRPLVDVEKKETKIDAKSARN